MNYCPICMNATLDIKDNGVVEILLNGKSISTGRFIYNRSKDSPTEILDNLTIKIAECLEWYNTLQNKPKIQHIDLLTGDFSCENRCSFKTGFKSSIIDILVSRESLVSILKELCLKYQFELLWPIEKTDDSEKL